MGVVRGRAGDAPPLGRFDCPSAPTFAEVGASTSAGRGAPHEARALPAAPHCVRLRLSASHDLPAFFALTLEHLRPRRNPRGHVLDVHGEVIPGLYGCGECGSVLGFLYAGGGWNIMETVASGRIAGEEAAAQEPRA